MTQDLIQDFSELYRAAYAERDDTRKVILLKEVQRRIRLCGDSEPFVDVSRAPRMQAANDGRSGKIGKAA